MMTFIFGVINTILCSMFQETYTRADLHGQHLHMNNYVIKQDACLWLIILGFS